MQAKVRQFVVSIRQTSREVKVGITTFNGDYKKRIEFNTTKTALFKDIRTALEGAWRE